MQEERLGGHQHVACASVSREGGWPKGEVALSYEDANWSYSRARRLPHPTPPFFPHILCCVSLHTFVGDGSRVRGTGPITSYRRRCCGNGARARMGRTSYHILSTAVLCSGVWSSRECTTRVVLPITSYRRRCCAVVYGAGGSVRRNV